MWLTVTNSLDKAIKSIIVQAPQGFVPVMPYLLQPKEEYAELFNFLDI